MIENEKIEEMMMGVEEKCENSLTALERDYGAIRTGRANPRILDRLEVEAYGGMSKLIELGNGTPPIVMVAFKDDFPTWNLVDPRKIRFGIGKIQGPAQIPQEHRGILLRDLGEAFFEFIHISHPCATEDVHRFWCSQAQMQIANGVQRHPITSFVLSQPLQQHFLGNAHSTGNHRQVPAGTAVRQDQRRPVISRRRTVIQYRTVAQRVIGSKNMPIGSIDIGYRGNHAFLAYHPDVQSLTHVT